MRRNLVLAAMCVAVAVAAGLWARSTSRALAELGRQGDRLREDVAARDQRITELEGIVRHSDALNLPQLASNPSPMGDAELLQRMRDLVVFQSNTVIALDRLNARLGAGEPPRSTEEQWHKGMVVLEQSLTELLQRQQAAREKASDLLLKLNIPDEIAQMDAGKGLDSGSLRGYWPYFEAKRERETHQVLAERLRLRIIQEQVDRPISQ
jgi:hypothetical protein